MPSTQPPTFIAVAQGVSREWMDEAVCRDVDHEIKRIWKVDNTETLTIGGSTYQGEKLIQLALIHCRACPVQWDCTAFAIQIEAEVGTWGARIGHIRKLRRRRDWRQRLDDARRRGVPVQVMISRL